MKLIVEELALNLRSLNGEELATASCISDSSRGSPVQEHGGSRSDRNSRLDHDLIDDLGVGLDLKVTFSTDADEAGQKGLTRHSEVVELQVTIVDAVVA